MTIKSPTRRAVSASTRTPPLLMRGNKVGNMRYRALLEAAPDAIVGLTPEGVILTWNYGAELTYGYAAAEAEGRAFLFLSPVDRIVECPKLLKKVQRGGTLEPFEAVHVKKDGTRIHISLTLSPIENVDGRVVGISKVLCVSGYTDASIVRHEVLKTGLEFLQKPFSPKSLVQKVSELLTPTLV